DITPPLTLTLPTDSRAPVPFSVRNYRVGSGELEIYLNGDLLEKGHDYLEVGATDSYSNQIILIATTSISVKDRLRFRIDSNGGVFMVGGGGGGGGSVSLQQAYADGNVVYI